MRCTDVVVERHVLPDVEAPAELLDCEEALAYPQHHVLPAPDFLLHPVLNHEDERLSVDLLTLECLVRLILQVEWKY